MMDAVGTCVYCGRGVCDDCKVRIYDKIHCRECVEAGRVRGNEPPPQAYQPIMVPYYYQMPPLIRFPPKPKGPINAAPLRIGAFGGLFGAIGLFITGGTAMFSSALMVVSLTIFALGLMLLAVAGYGIYWNFGCSWGLFGTITLPILAVILVISETYQKSEYQTLSSGFMFVVLPILVTSMVFVHLTTGHVRLHLATNSKMYGTLNFLRILNYLAGAGVAAFFVTSIFLFFIAGGILLLDFWVLMNVPLPEMPQQQQTQQTYNPAPVRPGY